MISAALEFIHARKWLVELILFAVIAAAIAAGCHHLIQVGVQRERAAWVKKLAEQQKAADIETARLKGRAEVAETAREKEHADLDQYRHEHPLHGRLCQPTASLPPIGAIANSGNGSAAAGEGDVLALPPGDPSAVGQRDPDVRGMLEALHARADLLSAQVREWQSR